MKRTVSSASPLDIYGINTETLRRSKSNEARDAERFNKCFPFWDKKVDENGLPVLTEDDIVANIRDPMFLEGWQHLTKLQEQIKAIRSYNADELKKRQEMDMFAQRAGDTGFQVDMKDLGKQVFEMISVGQRIDDHLFLKFQCSMFAYNLNVPQEAEEAEEAASLSPSSEATIEHDSSRDGYHSEGVIQNGENPTEPVMCRRSQHCSKLARHAGSCNQLFVSTGSVKKKRSRSKTREDEPPPPPPFGHQARSVSARQRAALQHQGSSGGSSSTLYSAVGERCGSCATSLS